MGQSEVWLGWENESAHWPRRKGQSFQTLKSPGREGLEWGAGDGGITVFPEPLASVPSLPPRPPVHSWARQAKGCGICGGADLLVSFWWA